VCAAEKGGNQLIAPVTAQAIAESFRFNMARGIWWVALLVVMPDHLHALMKFPVEPGIDKAIGNWKHFLSRTHNIHWQRDFFEHRLRNDEQQIEKAHYIRMNPVRRGLVTEPEAWPFTWTFDDLKDSGGQGTGRPTGKDI
jgi:putative transposase